MDITTLRLAIQALRDEAVAQYEGYMRVGYETALEDLEQHLEEWEEEHDRS